MQVNSDLFTLIFIFSVDHAPLSKGLLVLTGTASFFNILFASSTKHFLPNNPWIQIACNSKVLVNIDCFIYNSNRKMLVMGNIENSGGLGN